MPVRLIASSFPVAVYYVRRVCLSISRTEELFAPTSLLDDLNKARLQLLDGRDVLGQDTHIARFGWDVDLYTAWVLVLKCASLVSVQVSLGTYTSCDL